MLPSARPLVGLTLLTLLTQHASAAVAPRLPTVPTVEISPGVNMPLLNFGFQKNHTDAITVGVRGLDTAKIYGDPQQSEVGRAVRSAVASGLVTRSDLFVTTKVPCCPAKQFVGAVKGELICVSPQAKNTTHDIEHDFDELGLDYVDLMLVHWPCDDMADSVRTYLALEPLLKSGRARAIGVSNFNASALQALLPQVNVKPAVNQCGYSIAGHSEDLWGRDDATRDASRAAGIHYSAYSPLGGWAKGGTSHVLSDPTVNAVARAHNVSAAQVALRWVVQQGVIAVTSSDKIEHVRSDLEIFQFQLTDDEMDRLAKVV